MPKCRECNVELDYLNVIICQYVVARTNQLLEVVEDLEIRSDEVVHWECPECEEVLFWRFKDALNFVQG